MQSDLPVNSDLMNDLMTFTIQLPKTKDDASVSGKYCDHNVLGDASEQL